MPDIMLKQLQKEINSMPNIQDAKQVSVAPKSESVADRVTNTKTW